jgi:hypothetical protein
MTFRLPALAAAAAAALALGSLGPAAAASSQAGPRMTLHVWFERGGKLWLSKRTVAATTGVAAAAVDRLFAGPNAAETAAGVTSEAPAGTHLRGVSIASGTATIDAGRRFAAPAARTSIRMRLAELTYTATQFATVDRVRLEIAGREVLSIDGAPVPAPMTRANFVRLVPPILVDRPVIGARVPSTATVSGTADVFEGALTVRIVNAIGRLVALRHITASCGTGCRGTYSVAMPYHLMRAQPGTVVISSKGGKAGSRIVVRVPVRLSAG